MRWRRGKGVFWLERGIRLRDGRAELLGTHRHGKCTREKRFQPWRAANGSKMHALRCAPGTCLHGRARSNWASILHEFGGAAVHPPLMDRLREFLTLPSWSEQDRNASLTRLQFFTALRQPTYPRSR